MYLWILAKGHRSGHSFPAIVFLVLTWHQHNSITVTKITTTSITSSSYHIITRHLHHVECCMRLWQAIVPCCLCTLTHRREDVELGTIFWLLSVNIEVPKMLMYPIVVDTLTCCSGSGRWLDFPRWPSQATASLPSSLLCTCPISNHISSLLSTTMI